MLVTTNVVVVDEVVVDGSVDEVVVVAPFGAVVVVGITEPTGSAD